MRKSVFVFALCVFVIAAAGLSAQSVLDASNFATLDGWHIASGEWETDGTRLHQRSTTSRMARIDRQVPQEGVYEIRFNVRYEDGGFRTLEDLENQRFHAGFGVHVGLRDPLLGRESWGAGDGYLLWLNLDTRPETYANFPDHAGARAQVYRSENPVTMDLLSEPWIRRVLGQSRLSIDLIQAMEAAGLNVTVADVAPYLNQILPIRIRVDTRTGEVTIADPTAPIRYMVPLNPEVLRQGEYISLRTNSLAASFGNFRVVQVR